MQRSRRSAADVVLSRLQCRYICVSSANACTVTLCFWATAASSAVYNEQQRTEHRALWNRTYNVDHERRTAVLHNAKRNVLPERYDRSHASTIARSPNWRSSRSNSRSCSTVSKAAVRSSRQRADSRPEILQLAVFEPVFTSVRPSTKSFFDLNEIWYIGRPRGR